MFRVVVPFADLKDGGYVYNVGDIYPRMGVDADPKRLEELASNRNKRGEVLIVDDAQRSLREASGDVRETTADADPSETVEAKKKPRRGQKKDA